ncbi:MAG: hypothetical protein KatS3mg105_1168 [Gemmatales bacterium]|nr:MAG: hypothetical protein KatS3mg105_1168 [Gemmatales bacterium]
MSSLSTTKTLFTSAKSASKPNWDDIFVINRGLAPNEKFVLEGIRQVHDGEKIEYEWIKPEEALKHLKFHAE